jgi:IgA Peptidase M64/Peptidase M64 N-terminus
MKEILIWIILLLGPFSSFGGSAYDSFFTDDVLRFDYSLTGTHSDITIIQGQLKKEKRWSGSHNSLIEKLNLGTYRFQVYDQQSGELIFSKGFSPLFQEWQSTPEANVTSRAFYQVIRFPFPKKEIRLSIEQRNGDGNFNSIYSQRINPDNYFITAENSNQIPSETILYSGDPSHKIDIAILAEGYTESEMSKFVTDAKRLTDSLFAVEPFRQSKGDFNVYAVKSGSLESGTDIPGEHIYRNTVLNSTFYTFDISRYLTTSDMKAVHDMAADVPYDQLILLVNTSRYGGGGFYNFINVCSSDHPLSPNVFVHEFGHGFAGLADEYYTSEVTFDNYYNLKVEPWEPNLTTLVNFDLKWKSFLNLDTPVPTPRNEKYESTLGAFEGGGYRAKGIYSPMEDCRMKSNKTHNFCPVCIRAIQAVISENTK